MHYCGQACQAIDWNLHKFECKKFSVILKEKLAQTLNDDMTRTYLRILIRASVIVVF